MIRITLLFFVCIALIFTAQAQADMNFKQTSYDFGNVKPGSDTLWHSFTFTNTGNEALQIQDVKTSCDCTLAEWPKGLIQPGKSAVVRAGFKLANKSGSFEKSVIIIANTSPATSIVTIKGAIEDPGIPQPSSAQ